MKYAWIKEYLVGSRGRGRLAVLCRVLGVTRQGYYAWKNRKPGSRTQRKQELVTKVNEAYLRSRQTYGSPRVFRELKAQQVQISRNTVAKYMREEGLSARTPRPFRPQTTDSVHEQPVADNKLAQEFERATPDTGYVADITYIPTAEGWLFLAPPGGGA